LGIHGFEFKHAITCEALLELQDKRLGKEFYEEKG
jgi:hypothetical protein